MTETWVTSSLGPGSGTLTISSDGATVSWTGGSSPAQVVASSVLPSSGQTGVIFQVFGSAVTPQAGVGAIQSGYSDGNGFTWDYSSEAVCIVTYNGAIQVNYSAPTSTAAPVNGSYVSFIVNADSNVGWFSVDGGPFNGASYNGTIVFGSGVTASAVGGLDLSGLTQPLTLCAGYHTSGGAGSITALWDAPHIQLTGYSIESDYYIDIPWRSLNGNTVTSLTYTVTSVSSGTPTGTISGISGTATIPPLPPGSYLVDFLASNSPLASNTLLVTVPPPAGSYSDSAIVTSGLLSRQLDFAMPSSFTEMVISVSYTFVSGDGLEPFWRFTLAGSEVAGPNFDTSYATNASGQECWVFLGGYSEQISPIGSVTSDPPSAFVATARITNWVVSGGRATYDVDYIVNGEVTSYSGKQTAVGVTSFDGVAWGFGSGGGLTDAHILMSIYVNFIGASTPQTLSITGATYASSVLTIDGDWFNVEPPALNISLDGGTSFASASSSEFFGEDASGGYVTTLNGSLSAGTYPLVVQDAFTGVESPSYSFTLGGGGSETLTLVSSAGIYGLPMPLMGSDVDGPAGALDVSYGGTWAAVSDYVTTGGSIATWSAVGPALPFGATTVQVRNSSYTSVTSNILTLTATVPTNVWPAPAIPNPALAKFIGSYLYQEYNDDVNLQAFVSAFNSIAQEYVDWFNGINYPVYASNPNLAGPVLDWVGASLYGYPRPVLSGSAGQLLGAIGTTYIGELAIGATEQIGSMDNYVTSDDIYKRCLTWHLYKGDGKQFSIKWLKRRIMRFLYGMDGSDFIIDQTYPVSVTISDAAVTITLVNTPLYTSSVFSAAVASGVLELPPFYTYTIVT